VNVRSTRRFSQAISEGDGISVVARVASIDEALQAAKAGADALHVRGGVALPDANELPVLSSEGPDGSADALVLRTNGDDEDVARRYSAIVEAGSECVVEVRNDEELQRVLELLDPEIILLSCHEDAEDPFEAVLDLLPDVPAGKLVVADVGGAGEEAVAGLERVGVDAVIVAAADVAAVVGDGPPSV
jgi:hypothetical protein